MLPEDPFWPLLPEIETVSAVMVVADLMERVAADSDESEADLPAKPKELLFFSPNKLFDNEARETIAVPP